jgi:hypothetical protein
MRRVLMSAALALITTGAIAGCGDEASELSASSRCRDYLAASADDRSAALARAAEERGIGGASSPLGSANVDYICSQDPDVPLGDAVAGSGTQHGSTAAEPEASEAAPEPEPVEPPSISIANEGYTGEVTFLGYRYEKEGAPPPLSMPVVTVRLTNTSDRSAPLTSLVPWLRSGLEIPNTALKNDACPNNNATDGRRSGTCLLRMSQGYTGTGSIEAGASMEIDYQGMYFVDEEPPLEEVRVFFDAKRLPTE